MTSFVQPNTSFTMLAEAARTTVAAAYSASFDISRLKRMLFLLTVTNADTDAGDTLDVYIDVSPDGGTTWLNAAHFAQVIGTDGASKAYAVLDKTTPGTAVVAATSDAAASAVRPTLFGTHCQVRYVVVNAGTANASFTFGVKAFGQ